MLDIIEAAGWPIWLLIATSVVALGIIIERFLSLRSQRVIPNRASAQALELLRQHNNNPDSIARLAASSPLGQILAEVLATRQESPTARVAAVEDTGKDVAHQLNRYLPALSTIAAIGPLLGLFGTVVGMIEIFASYTPDGGDPAQLARGISIALYNTALGIIIAIPALIFHRYFRSRADHYLHQMEREATVLNRLINSRTAP